MLATRSGCSRCTLLAMRIRHVLMLATRWHERKRTILVLLESQFNFVRENVDRSKKLNCSWHIMPYLYVAPCFGYGPESRVLWNDVTGAGCPQATEKKACLKKTYWSYLPQIFETRLSKSSSFREQRYLNTGSGPYSHWVRNGKSFGKSPQLLKKNCRHHGNYTHFISKQLLKYILVSLC